MTKSKRKQSFDEDGNTVRDNKTGIMGFISRDGKVITEVMHPGKTFKQPVRDNVSKDATIVTDSHKGYEGLNIEFFT